MTQAKQLQVFICYASVDKPKVDPFYAYLSQFNITIWRDTENLVPGQDWKLEIAKAVQAADVIIVCLTENLVNNAGYFQKEIAFALDKAQEQPEGAISIIPVKLEECDVPVRLSQYQWANLQQPENYSKMIISLALSARLLKRTPVKSLASDQVSPPNIYTGGAYVGGNVSVNGGDFVGRDKNVYINNPLPPTADELFEKKGKLLQARRESQEIPEIVANFIKELAEKLTTDVKFHDITRNIEFKEFDFIGYLKTPVTVNWVALVYADQFTESDIVNYRDRYFEIVLELSIKYALKPRGRNPNGLLCFIFEKGCSSHFTSFIQAQSRISHGIRDVNKGAVVVSWVFDLAQQKIHTNHSLVSIFPPVFVIPATLIPNPAFFDRVLSNFLRENNTL